YPYAFHTLSIGGFSDHESIIWNYRDKELGIQQPDLVTDLNVHLSINFDCHSGCSINQQ
ncbi:hypothetical protein HHI36_008624, partial [Cryptolaemus montrouzieri]